jgi:hypothetical protein
LNLQGRNELNKKKEGELGLEELPTGAATVSVKIKGNA